MMCITLMWLLNSIENFSFILTNRYKEDNMINLDFVKKEKLNEFDLFEITVRFSTDMDKIIDGEIWDLHLLRKIDDNEVKSRIKSNKNQLDLYSIVQEDVEKMFYPYTTNKGNISFRASDYKLFSLFDEVNVQKDGTLQFSGFFNYPPLF